MYIYGEKPSMSPESSEIRNAAANSSITALLTPFELGSLHLPNRVVMSPMTRARSTNGVPVPLEAQYYLQRVSAGLIITGGIYVSPKAVGAVNVPGIYTEE